MLILIIMSKEHNVRAIMKSGLRAGVEKPAWKSIRHAKMACPDIVHRGSLVNVKGKSVHPIATELKMSNATSSRMLQKISHIEHTFLEEAKILSLFNFFQFIACILLI